MTKNNNVILLGFIQNIPMYLKEDVHMQYSEQDHCFYVSNSFFETHTVETATNLFVNLLA